MMKEKLFSITDLEVTYFSGKGAGGQYRNRHKNCVRIKHLGSGVIVTGQSQRSKRQNILEALKNLKEHPKFKVWLMRKVYEVCQGKTIDEIVDEAMQPKNLRIEVKTSKGWEKDLQQR